MLLVLIFSGCVSSPTSRPTEQARPADEQDIIFQQAQALFDQGNEEKAMAAFSHYLGRFPQGRHAAAAMQRIGLIYQHKGESGAAEAFFRNAIEQFPDDPATQEARLSLMDLMVLDGRFDQAVEMGNAMLASNPDAAVRTALLERLVRWYRERNDVRHTALYTYMLFKTVPAPDNRVWADQLIETIGGLSGEDIAYLWDSMKDREIRSYMMYRYATVQVVTENYDDALEVLTAFQAAFPNHPYAVDVANLIGTVTQRLSFTPHTIGCLLPLSGAYEAYGRRALNAIEMALSLIQSAERPAPIRLVVKDTASRDGVAIQAVRDLSQMQVGAIIGPIITAPAASREAQRLNIPIVTFTQKPEITATGDFVFRNFITPGNQVKTLVRYFVDDLGLRDFAIMYPRENYGRTFMTVFWDEVINQGGRVVGAESYGTDQTDFADAIKKLVGTYYPIPEDLQAKPVVLVEDSPYYQDRNGAPPTGLEDLLPDPITRISGLFHQDPDQDRIKGPALGRRSTEDQIRPNVDFDVLFIPDSPKMAGLILPQLAYYDVKNIFTVGTNLWHSQQLIDMTRQYAQNAVMVDGFYKDSQSSVVRQFVDTYKSIYGAEPGIIEAFAFDTANLLFSLLAQPDLHMHNELRDALKQLFFADGVTGATAYGQDGEAIKHLTLLRVKGSQFVEIPRQ